MCGESTSVLWRIAFMTKLKWLRVMLWIYFRILPTIQSRNQIALGGGYSQSSLYMFERILNTIENSFHIPSCEGGFTCACVTELRADSTKKVRWARVTIMRLIKSDQTRSIIEVWYTAAYDIANRVISSNLVILAIICFAWNMRKLSFSHYILYHSRKLKKTWAFI